MIPQNATGCTVAAPLLMFIALAVLAAVLITR